MARNISKVSSVVSTKWLSQKISQRAPNLTVLDGSFHMPFTKRNPRNEYLEKHIPGSPFFGVDECCDKDVDIDHMLPKQELFSTYIGSLGIDNNTHVVIYDNNENLGIFSAQRVWWTFRVFGHDLVSVLDGGLPKWIRDGYETTSELPVVIPKTFHATFRQNLVKSFDDIQDNFKHTSFTVLDARSCGRFDGTAPEPRQGIPSGHMPGAVNIPFTEMLNPETKTLKSSAEIQKVFELSGINLNKPLVGSCGTGISACMLALAAFQLGKDDFAVYDGSWTEYAQRVPKEQICTKN